MCSYSREHLLSLPRAMCLCMGNSYSCRRESTSAGSAGTAGCSRSMAACPSGRRRSAARWAGTAAHSCGCRLALISASLVSWEVQSVSLFATELLGGKVTVLCAPGLSLSSFIQGSWDLCLQAPCPGAPLCCGFTFLAGASSKGPAGSPLHPAPTAGPQGGCCPGASTETPWFLQLPIFYKETSSSCRFLSGNAKMVHNAWALGMDEALFHLWPH